MQNTNTDSFTSPEGEEVKVSYGDCYYTFSVNGEEKLTLLAHDLYWPSLINISKKKRLLVKNYLNYRASLL